MKRKTFQEESKAGAPEWMTTYGDMVTLLLCFFVLLFALSTIDVEKFKVVMSSFQGSLSVMESGKTIEDSEFITEALKEDRTTEQLEEMEDFKKLQEQLESFLQENAMDQQVLLELEYRGLLIRFTDNVLFDSGRAELKPQARLILGYLTDLLNNDEFEDKFIRVEGHTDSDPIIGVKNFPTNWELSVTRASNVVRFMAEEMHLKPNRLSASGYSQYHPVAPNDTDENKAKNRRVDIVILRSELLDSQPYY